jgi:hypothetical protein
MADLLGILTSPGILTLLFGFAYALSGYFEGLRTNNESFDIVVFGKTIVTFLVTSGIVSQANATTTLDQLVAFGSATGASVAIDNWVNSLINAHRAKPVAAPASPSTSPASSTGP